MLLRVIHLARLHILNMRTRNNTTLPKLIWLRQPKIYIDKRRISYIPCISKTHKFFFDPFILPPYLQPRKKAKSGKRFLAIPVKYQLNILSLRLGTYGTGVYQTKQQIYTEPYKTKCPLCDNVNEPETIRHMLFFCPKTQRIRNQYNIQSAPLHRILTSPFLLDCSPFLKTNLFTMNKLLAHLWEKGVLNPNLNPFWFGFKSIFVV